VIERDKIDAMQEALTALAERSRSDYAEIGRY